MSIRRSFFLINRVFYDEYVLIVGSHVVPAARHVFHCVVVMFQGIKHFLVVGKLAVVLINLLFQLRYLTLLLNAVYQTAFAYEEYHNKECHKCHQISQLE